MSDIRRDRAWDIADAMFEAACDLQALAKTYAIDIDGHYAQQAARLAFAAGLLREIGDLDDIERCPVCGSADFCDCTVSLVQDL